MMHSEQRLLLLLQAKHSCNSEVLAPAAAADSSYHLLQGIDAELPAPTSLSAEYWNTRYSTNSKPLQQHSSTLACSADTT
jgi:hypothetical protein